MSHPLDQFSPETGDKPKVMVEVEINVSFDISVKVPEDFTKDDLKAAADRWGFIHGIKQSVSVVEENF